MMKFYKTLIEGRNCWANLDGTCRRLGFVTIRAAPGTDVDQAATAIQRKLTDELRAILLSEKEDITEIAFGELEEIDEETAREIPGAGCTWYPDGQPLSNEAV
jgi:hypothetical protein